MPEPADRETVAGRIVFGDLVFNGDLPRDEETPRGREVIDRLGIRNVVAVGWRSTSARLHSGRVELATQRVDLVKVVGEAVDRANAAGASASEGSPRNRVREDVVYDHVACSRQRKATLDLGAKEYIIKTSIVPGDLAGIVERWMPHEES